MDSNSFLQTDIDSVICVDIYKQPAFDHPALKNHKIQTKPTFSSEFMTKKVSTTAKLSAFDLPSKPCPKGMFATIKVKADDTNYHGALASINIQNPKVKMNQYSKAQIWLENGPTSELNSIQAGWGADGYKKTGCYNTQCPGFVQVHPRMHIGVPIPNISTFGGQQYVLDITIVLDKTTGNWWLIMKNMKYIHVGYWPGAIFTHLRPGASLVRYGGNTFISTHGISPPMGNGHYASNLFKESCYFSYVSVINEQNLTLDIDDSKVSKYESNTTCFTLEYFQTQPNMGKTFTFGGPGGSCSI
ncbi:hypothetical protein REPUB_Repub07fG0234000 [Reevesia pubescens]